MLDAQDALGAILGQDDLLGPEEIARLNEFENFLSFRRPWWFDVLTRLDHRFKALFCGNQTGKTASAMFQYVMRTIGIHPNPALNVLVFECVCGRKYSDSILRGLITDPRDIRNLRPENNICSCGLHLKIRQRRTHTFRLFAENLPTDSEGGESGDGEIKNSTYPALKRWLPPFLVKKDITSRNPSLRVLNINSERWFGDLFYRGDDIIFEFMSYGQSTQAGAGVQRLSVYYDEEPPRDIHAEQLPRLLAEDGDIIIGLTPANSITWTYDEIYERACVYIRTKAVCDFLEKDSGKPVGQVQFTGTDSDIAVIQTATDDNPTLSPQAIERLFALVEDADEVATRRYGVHKQVSGRIFKDFNPSVHVINPEQFFSSEDGLPPETFKHIRAVDYHTHNPWAILWVALSPQDEMFVYQEWAPSPDRFVTKGICERVVNMSSDRKYEFNIIDPLANSVQINTGTTTVQDMNREFHSLRNEGVGSGGYWEAWDTKSTRGREKIRERLKNSLKAGIPFNNRADSREGADYLPTIWFFNTTVETIRSMKSWRLETWATSNKMSGSKDRKETPQQRFSHFPMCIEAILKDVRFRPPTTRKARPRPAPNYMRRT